MNKKLILAGTGAAVIAAAGFGSIAAAQDDDTPAPTAEESSGAPTGQLDAVPEDTETASNEELFEDQGGTVLVRCTDGGPELVWWVAADGYSVDDVESAPDDDRDDDAEVEFTSGSTEVDYDVTCFDGVPEVSVEIEDDEDDDDDDRDDDDQDDDDGRDDDRDDRDDDGNDD